RRNEERQFTIGFCQVVLGWNVLSPHGHHAREHDAVRSALKAHRCAPSASRSSGLDGASVRRRCGTRAMAVASPRISTVRNDWPSVGVALDCGVGGLSNYGVGVDLRTPVVVRTRYLDAAVTFCDAYDFIASVVASRFVSYRGCALVTLRRDSSGISARVL